MGFPLISRQASTQQFHPTGQIVIGTQPAGFDPLGKIVVAHIAAFPGQAEAG